MTVTAIARRRTLKLAALASLLFVAIPATVPAQVLYNSGPPDNSGSMGNNNWTTGGAPIGMGWETANDFKLNQGGTLNYFTWYALFFGYDGPSPVTASFFWNVMTDNGGKPGSILASGTVTNEVAEVTGYGCCEPRPWEYQSYRMTTNLGGITLGAGTYWLSIGDFSSSYGQAGGAHYFWSNATLGRGNETKRWADGGWRSLNADGAFALHGEVPSNVVPEPASIALLVTGLTGVGVLRRRRKQR